MVCIPSPVRETDCQGFEYMYLSYSADTLRRTRLPTHRERNQKNISNAGSPLVLSVCVKAAISMAQGKYDVLGLHGALQCLWSAMIKNMLDLTNK